MLKLASLATFLVLTIVEPLIAQVEIGRIANDDEIAAWDIDVRPDGVGLPKGAGDVFTGEEIFSEKCAVCHGDFGEGLGLYPALAGGEDSIIGTRPVKSIGSFVPYLSTVFDFINRAKPFGDAQSLSDDQTYALVAYLLYLNDLVDDDFELNDDNFTEIKLPNEANFFLDDRSQSEIPVFSLPPCMSECKQNVIITARGLVDVTPTVEAEPIVTSPSETQLIASGEKLFKKCKACHQVGKGAENRAGPVLNNVIGRVAGAFEGFKYSKPMLDAGVAGLVWEEESLIAFLSNPRKFVKGTKMSFSGFRKNEELLAMLAYLASIQN